MNNIKIKLVSIVTLVSLAGSPVLGLAHTSSTAAEDAHAAVHKEIDDLKSAREAFKEARKQEEDSRSMEAKERREAQRKELEVKRVDAERRKEEHRKKVLLRLIDVQIKHLNNVWRRVEKMKNITDAKKTELKAEIDKAIAGLKDLAVKVKAATTPEQLKELTKMLRDYIKSKNDLVKKIVDSIAADALRDSAMKAEERIKTAEAKIVELKAAGKDVTALEALLATAKSKLEAAKTAGTKEAWAEMREALKDVYEALKEFAKKAEND